MNIFTFLEAITFLSIVKLLIVTLMGVYCIFALLMMRQIAAMTKAVTMQDDFIIRALGVIHFVFAMVVFLYTLTLPIK